MEKDAVSAGVSEIGGLFSTAEVRILICYIISSINQPVPGRMLGDLLHYEGIANVFEVNDSIASLCESGQLKVFNEDEDKLSDDKKSLLSSLLGFFAFDKIPLYTNSNILQNNNLFTKDSINILKED